jgi:fucose permease
MPSDNIASTMNKIIDRVKRFDIQHGQRRRDPILETVYVPIICASVLFFTWGFADGLLDTMNNHVGRLVGLSRAMSALLAVAYYVAYPVAVFGIASPLVKCRGYRFTFIVGLLIFGIGNFVMMAVTGKLAGMVAACFVVGRGVATLERSANHTLSDAVLLPSVRPASTLPNHSLVSGQSFCRQQRHASCLAMPPRK